MNERQVVENIIGTVQIITCTVCFQMLVTFRDFLNHFFKIWTQNIANIGKLELENKELESTAIPHYR